MEAAGAKPVAGTRRAEVAFLFAVVAAFTWWAASPWLDDRDGALFISALERFSLAEHRPHPPGYATYVALGKVAHVLVGDPFQALRLVGAIAAGVAAALIPAVLRHAGLEGTRLWIAVAISIASPLFVLTGCKVLTDMPGLVVVLAATLGIAAAPNRRPFVQGLLVGLGAGMRPHALLPTAPLLLVRAGLGPRLLGLVAGTAVWVGGTVAVLDPSSVLDATVKQAMHRFEHQHVSLFVPGQTVAGAVARAKTFAWRALRDVPAVEGLPERLVVLLVLFTGALLLWRDAGRDARRAWLRPWILGGGLYAVFLYMFLPPHPRYVLPLVPLFAASLVRTLGSFAVLAVPWLVFASFERMRLLHDEAPPPESLVQWMAEVDPDRELAYVPGPLFPHVRVRDPQRLEHPWIGDEPPPAGVRVFTDRAALVHRAQGDEGGWRVVAERSFSRDKRVHDKDETMTLWLVERRR